MYSNSIRFKTSIFFSSILGLILITYSFALFIAVKSILYDNVDSKLQIKADKVVSTLNAYAGVAGADTEGPSIMGDFLTDTKNKQISREIVDKLWKADVMALNMQNDFIRILNERGEIVLISSNIPKESGNFISGENISAQGAAFRSNVRFGERRMRLISRPFLYNQDVPLTVQVATPLESVDTVLNRMLFFILVGIVSILVLSSFLGIVLTKQILRPVAAVTESANQITYKNMHTRIAEQEADIEMKALIHAFNTMIGRLEASFAHINEFSSHVAHELKTPLTIIKGEVELALANSRSAEEYKSALMIVLKEIDQLIQITKDLLLLAKLDYKMNIFQLKETDIIPFLNEFATHCKILVAEKGIDFEASIPDQSVPVAFDRVHLNRLFFNLVQNAVNYTPRNGRIALSVQASEEEIYISVSDTGPGIPDAFKSKIFDKFFRVRSAEQSSAPGYGLGLSVAQSIAKFHEGRIEVASRQGEGSTFTVSLPVARKLKKLVPTH